MRCHYFDKYHLNISAISVGVFVLLDGVDDDVGTVVCLDIDPDKPPSITTRSKNILHTIVCTDSLNKLTVINS